MRPTAPTSGGTQRRIANGFRPLAALLPTVAVLVAATAGPGAAYLYYARSPDDLVATPRTAIGWEPGAFPLPFRILLGERPEGISAALWVRLVEESFARWESVGTAHVRFDVSTDPSADAVVEGNSGVNEVGFSQELAAQGIRGRAAFSVRAGAAPGDDRFTECDVRVTTDLPETWTARGVVEDELRDLLTHEIGHCLGLAHTEQYPLATFLIRERRAPDRFLPHPMMSYGEGYGLSEDDAVAVSLRYPASGFLESRGGLGGRLTLDGTPARFAYVQAFYATADDRPGPGVYADENGAFHLEGLHPGPVLLWAHPIMTFASNAHLLREALDSGVADFEDHFRWAVVTAGETLVLPDFELTRGR